VTHNQLSPRSVDTDPVIVIDIITSQHLGYNKLDITVELVALLLVFRRSSIQISAQRLSIVQAETFHGAAHSFPTNAWKASHYSMTASFHIHFNL